MLYLMETKTYQIVEHKFVLYWHYYTISLTEHKCCHMKCFPIFHLPPPTKILMMWEWLKTYSIQYFVTNLQCPWFLAQWLMNWNFKRLKFNSKKQYNLVKETTARCLLIVFRVFFHFQCNSSLLLPKAKNNLSCPGVLENCCFYLKKFF